MKKKPEPDDKEQSARFVETAERLVTEEDEKNFEVAIQLIARKRPIDPGNKQ
ncbi:valine--tRNA ligase [Rhodanobacter sp. B04]|uniref:valine--tRNA ligase n=1 Tax=Rhodanobacter sp. B04 TaxID=1945860 RepID=UPI00111598D0|nr:valine--tRNA ligase [Rhodanobacter sp. B04]